MHNTTKVTIDGYVCTLEVSVAFGIWTVQCAQLADTVTFDVHRAPPSFNDTVALMSIVGEGTTESNAMQAFHDRFHDEIELQAKRDEPRST